MCGNSQVGRTLCIISIRDRNKNRRDAGISNEGFSWDAGISICGCRYLLHDAGISLNDAGISVIAPTAEARVETVIVSISTVYDSEIKIITLFHFIGMADNANPVDNVNNV